MNVAILGTPAPGVERPLAEGLRRMLLDLGADATIFYNGLARLGQVAPSLVKHIAARGYRSVLRGIARYGVSRAFLRELKQFDVVVVVGTIPPAFLENFFHDTAVREALPGIPIVLYSNYYLLTRPWAVWLKSGNPARGISEPGNWGLERYDWYLCSSVVSEYRMPDGRQPYSLIGVNLDDGSLWPERKDDFVALIDFERPQHLAERAIQLEACDATKTKYTVLRGVYPIEEIRAIYRGCSIYFVAFRESFGLPICELQACGSYVFTPYSDWCPSHWLKDDLTKAGPGRLSDNFVVYDNSKATLVRSIERVRDTYDPYAVAETFRRYHPQLFYGDKRELGKFLSMVEDGTITGDMHKEHTSLSAVTVGQP